MMAPWHAIAHDRPAAPYVQVASAWRASVRPQRTPRLWPNIAALAIILACLAAFAVTHHAMPRGEATRVITTGARP